MNQSKVPPTSLEPFAPSGDTDLNKDTAKAWKDNPEADKALGAIASPTKYGASSSIISEGPASIPKSGGPDAQSA